MAQFLAYDGEAVDGRYTLLANSRRYVHNPDGLSTVECLDFLYHYELDKPIRVTFAFEYDITKILGDLDLEQLGTLMHTGNVEYGGYEITHIPRRIFTINRIGGHRGTRKTYYDTWGFFQTSFLNTLDEYRKGGLNVHTKEVEIIEWGKRVRENFQATDLQQVIQYNRLECMLLERIMAVLREACHVAGWKPSAWYGPGVLADKLLKELKADLYLPRYTPVLQAVAHRARYGGRFEMFKRGHFDGPVYRYDINSAYPYAMSLLPDMTGAWEQTPQWIENSFGIYQVCWTLPMDTNIGPLPFRTKQGEIYYPPQGKGFYHVCELAQAIQWYGLASHCGENGIHIHQGWILQDQTRMPFRNGILRVYEQRRKYKADKSFNQMPLKLAMNASYGKLAQRIGTNRPFENWISAGYIQAYTRAMLMKAMAYAPSAIIGTMADGIASLERLPIPVDGRLGAWDEQETEAFEALLPGIYRYKVGGAWTDKRRGYRGLDYDTLWKELEHSFTATVRETMFVPYRLAVFAPYTFGPYRGEWIAIEKEINPEAGHKRLWLHNGLLTPRFQLNPPQDSISAPVVEWGIMPDYWSYPAKHDDVDPDLRGASEAEIVAVLANTQ